MNHHPAGLRPARETLQPRGLTSPHALSRRATEILMACGGPPGRVALANRTPRIDAARAADLVGWHLMFARNGFDFLRLARGKGVASLAWHYRAYAKDRRSARTSLNLAVERLAEAERIYATFSVRRRAA